LTGTKSVTLVERDGDPYYLTVTTIDVETPDKNETRRALIAAKPAGIILQYGGLGVLQTWDELKARVADWNACKAMYANWADAKLNIPIGGE
jgi:hypothetical protein